MRTFLSGLMCGACAVALAVYLWSSPATSSLSSAGPQPDNISRSLQASTDWTPPPRVAEPKPAQASLTGRTVEATVSSAPLPAPTAAIPSIALSAEHTKMIALNVRDGRPPIPPELHAQLATEPKDTAWTYAMEQSIRQAIAASNASGELDVVTVECRQSLCEVLAFGNQPTSLDRWNQVWDEISKQPWHTGITGGASAASTQGGRQTFATLLQRSRP